MAGYLCEDADEQLKWQYEHDYLIPRRFSLKKDDSGQWCIKVAKRMTLRLLPEAIEIKVGSKSDAPGTVMCPLVSLKGRLEPQMGEKPASPKLILMADCPMELGGCETVDEMDWIASLLSRLYGIPYDREVHWSGTPANPLWIVVVLAALTVVALVILALVDVF